MGESGTEGSGELVKAGEVLEGEAGEPGDTAQREGMPPFRGAARTDPGLDLLAEMNEPEQLMRELKKFAEPRRVISKSWEGVYRLCERAEEYFLHINQVRPNRPQP